MTEADATQGCECVVAEMQKRWGTPRQYNEDTAKHNQEMIEAGVPERCRPKPLPRPTTSN